MKNEAYTIIRNAFSMAIPTQLLKEETTLAYSEEIKNEILELSKKKKYTPFVAKHLIDVGIDQSFWMEQYDFYLTRNKAILSFIDELFEDFFEQGIESVFVYENFGGLLSSGSDLALYASGDVDLCADKTEFDAINAIMVKNGFTLKPQKNEGHNIFRVGYQGKIGETDYRINLMFKPLVRYRMPVSVSQEIICSDNMRFYQNTHIRIPTQEVLLYLNLMRISVHGYVRSPDMRLYVDVYNCSIGQTDWEQVISWAKKDGNLNRIVAVAYVANCLFGTDVPQWILEMKNDSSLRANGLIRLVCSTESKCLNYSPSRKERHLIEYYSDGYSFARGMWHSIFPDKNWMKEYYGREGKGRIYEYRRYISFVLKGIT